MLRHIEELRKKPKAVRNQYAFGIALSITLLIATVWAISLPARLTFEEPVVAEETPAGPTFTEQLSEINTFFGDGLEEIKTQAEIIGAAETEERAVEPAPIVDPATDTAHYDFFPATGEPEEGNPTVPLGALNQ